MSVLFVNTALITNKTLISTKNLSVAAAGTS